MSQDGTSAMLDHLPPQATEAEEAVLGSLLMDSEATGRVAAILKPEDFYREHNGQIFAAALALYQAREPVDFRTLTDALRRCGQYEDVGGMAYLSNLVGVVPTAVHVEHYARTVERCARRRRLISAATRIAGRAYDENSDLDALLREAYTELGKAAGQVGDNRIVTPSEQAADLWAMALEMEETGATGLKTGFHKLDYLTGGLQPGELIVLLGDTGVGKSAWAQSLCRQIASASASHQPKTSLYCSIEMGKRLLVQRNASAIMGRSWKDLAREIAAKQNGEANQDSLKLAADTMEQMPIHLYCRPRMTPGDVRAKALEMASTVGLDLVVVDYLQLITGPKAENRVGQIGAISRELKAIAEELQVPLVTLSQIPREVIKGRTDKRPTLHDARESGSVEQDADILLGIYRHDAYYEPGTAITDQGRAIYVTAGEAELLILKHRSGEDRRMEKLVWMPERVAYASRERE